MEIGLSVILTVLGIVTSVAGLAGWVTSRIKASQEDVKEIVRIQMQGIGRTLDNHKEEIEDIHETLATHSHKISQSDVVMIHIDETLKQLGAAVTKLDATLNALQVSFAKIEGMQSAPKPEQPE